MTNLAPFVENKLGRTVTNSRAVADLFGKQHKDVLRAIDNLDCSQPFRERNFTLTTVTHLVGAATRTLRSFELTKDGFVFLAMGFTGKKALQFKLRYIEQFNAMEAELKAQGSQAILQLQLRLVTQP